MNGLKGRILFRPFKNKEQSYSLSHTQKAQLLSKRENMAEKWPMSQISDTPSTLLCYIMEGRNQKTEKLKRPNI